MSGFATVHRLHPLHRFATTTQFAGFETHLLPPDAFRDDLDERITQLRAELEGDALDEVHREVLLMDLQRLQGLAERAP